MRVTITVDDVVQEIEVRPDLLRPGMGEHQDATEVALLVAFGTAYHQAVAHRRSIEAQSDMHVEVPADVSVAFDTETTAPEGDVEVVVDTDEDATLSEGLPVDATYDPEAEPVRPDAIYVPVEEIYIPTEEQVTLSEAGFVPLDADPVNPTVTDAPATDPAPVAEPCLCGHPRPWHVQEPESDDYETAFGACQMEWAIDEKDPSMGRGRCSCLRYSANALIVALD